MAILQKAVFALISTLCFYKFSQAQECQIDFHIESASVMVLAGEDASALCDASCFGHSGDISVVWLDTAGRQIDKQSGRISTVLENDGLMNRLLIQSSSAAESGTYMCSVTRDGEVLEEKALSFYIFGNFDYEDKKPIDEGPRRGDIVPRRELDYRPVRSLDWILKRLTSLRTSSDLDTKGSRIQENGVQINRRKNVSDGSVSGVETAIYRRKGPDDMDTAPLTLLNDPVDLGGEEDPRILNLVDPDTSLSSDEEEAATENYKEDSGQVSTFLLRQQSLGEQNENADKDSSVKNSQEDKPKLLTSTDAGTPHRPADGTGPDTVVNV